MSIDDLPLEVKEKLNEVINNLRSIVLHNYISKTLQVAISTYVNNPGKLIRPTLTLLTTYLLGGDLKRAVYAATAIECVHIATLLQDDVFDQHILRRGVETPFRKYGLEFSILASNVFIAKAVEYCTYTNVPEVLLEIANAAIRLADGESREAELRKAGLVPTLRDYLSVVLNKTASLIEASIVVAAYISDLRNIVPRLRVLGRLLGLAYQIRDDILDYLKLDGQNPEEKNNVNIVQVMRSRGLQEEDAIRRSLIMFTRLVDACIKAAEMIFQDRASLLISLVKQQIYLPLLHLIYERSKIS